MPYDYRPLGQAIGNIGQIWGQYFQKKAEEENNQLALQRLFDAAKTYAPPPLLTNPDIPVRPPIDYNSQGFQNQLLRTQMSNKDVAQAWMQQQAFNKQMQPEFKVLNAGDVGGTVQDGRFTPQYQAPQIAKPTFKLRMDANGLPFVQKIGDKSWTVNDEYLNGNPTGNSELDKDVSRSVLPQGNFVDQPAETKDTWYEQYRLTGVIPPFAYRDVASRNEFVQGYPKYLKSMGINPTDAVVQKTTYKALSGSLNNQQKVYNMMGSFVNNLKTQVDRVKELFKNVDRTGLRLADVPLREWKTKAIGSGQEAVIGSYLNEISNEIGKLSTGSQASISELSISAQERWAKIHDPNLSWKELEKVLTATSEQADIRRSSAQQEIAMTKNEMSSLGKEEKPTEKDNNPTKNWWE